MGLFKINYIKTSIPYHLQHNSVYLNKNQIFKKCNPKLSKNLKSKV